MKYEAKFVMSHRPYAVNLDSFVIQFDGCASIDAVWFRRRRGVTVACVGYLWNYPHDDGALAVKFLQQFTDGRYGGNTLGRWDGTRYWGAQVPSEIQKHLDLLRPMLANFPQIPTGYDGWWVF